MDNEDAVFDDIKRRYVDAHRYSCGIEILTDPSEGDKKIVQLLRSCYMMIEAQELLLGAEGGKYRPVRDAVEEAMRRYLWHIHGDGANKFFRL